MFGLFQKNFRCAPLEGGEVKKNDRTMKGVKIICLDSPVPMRNQVQEADPELVRRVTDNVNMMVIRGRVKCDGVGAELMGQCCKRIANEITRAATTYSRDGDLIPGTTYACTPLYWETTFYVLYAHRKCILPEDHPSSKRSAKFIKHACATMSYKLQNRPNPWAPAHNYELFVRNLTDWIRPIC